MPNILPDARLVRTPTHKRGCSEESEEYDPSHDDQKELLECRLSDWVPITACSKSCGVGTILSKRHIIRQGTTYGCNHALTRLTKCNMHDCPIDCVQSTWGAFTACDVGCGTGSRTRLRPVISVEQLGGRPCTNTTTETESCDAGPCAVNCKVSEFSAYSACTATCGVGHMTRTRSVIDAVAEGGTVCPRLFQTVQCVDQR